MSELQEKVFSVVAEELNVEVDSVNMGSNFIVDAVDLDVEFFGNCLLYTSPSPRDGLLSRMPSSA